MVLFFFFFQAEDGIRDKLVTGVQTCALPISYYQELSSGLLDIQGQTYGPALLDSNEVTYAGKPPCTGNPIPTNTNCNGLFDFSYIGGGGGPVTRKQKGGLPGPRENHKSSDRLPPEHPGRRRGRGVVPVF